MQTLWVNNIIMNTQQNGALYTLSLYLYETLDPSCNNSWYIGITLQSLPAGTDYLNVLTQLNRLDSAN